MPPDLHLPADVHIDALLGEGRRSTVYAGTYHGEPVAVKAYRPDMMQKCRRRYGVSLAEFEYRRNSDTYAIAAIRHYVARPLALFGEGDGYSHAFIQERVEGIRLRSLAEQIGHVPPETQAALETLVREAHAAGIYDLDLCPNNIRVRDTAAGWQPILFDFNMMPQYLFSRNPATRLLYKVGLRKPWSRDCRHLADFADWPNRIRRYQIPLVGLKIRAQLLNRYEFFTSRSIEARRNQK
jgi:hypothetical protein